MANFDLRFTVYLVPQFPAKAKIEKGKSSVCKLSVYPQGTKLDCFYLSCKT